MTVMVYMFITSAQVVYIDCVILVGCLLSRATLVDCLTSFMLQTLVATCKDQYYKLIGLYKT